MAAALPDPPRRRIRRGSVERPVSGRLYRAGLVVATLPLLILSLSISRPEPLPPPLLPPTFDGTAALARADDLSTSFPSRLPGSAGAFGAADWVESGFEELGLAVTSDRFGAALPDEGETSLRNIAAVVTGRSKRAIVVLAHRDNLAVGPGANDNASGTAALLELARPYGSQANVGGRPLRPVHTLVFLSADGGSFGGLGARRFLERSPFRKQIDAVVNLVALGGERRARLELAGDRPRTPAATLVRTASARIADETGAPPRRTAAASQFLDLAFPISLYDQGSFVGRGIPAVTITTADQRPPEPRVDTAARLRGVRLDRLGRAAAGLIGSLDQGLELGRGPSAYLYLGSRVVPGWALGLVLLGLLAPVALALVDLLARCQRRGVPLAPAFMSLLLRFGFWLAAAGLFALFGLLGVWVEAEPVPLPVQTTEATSWPLGALAAYGIVLAIGWLIVRERLLPRRGVSAEEELAGHVAALVAGAAIALAVAATSPFALIFVLPSLHAWLWLPGLRGRPAALRAGVFLAGLAGPLLLVGSLAWRFELGFDAPWYLAQLAAVGYVPLPAVAIAVLWLAVAAQTAALVAGRYAPPHHAEAGALGRLAGTALRAVRRPFTRGALSRTMSTRR